MNCAPKLCLILLSIGINLSPACGHELLKKASEQNTFREEFAESAVVVFGWLENSKVKEDEGTTELWVLKSFKGEDYLIGQEVHDKKRVVTLPRYIPNPNPKESLFCLAFGEVKDKKTLYYRGVTGRMGLADYLDGVSSFPKREKVKLLRFCFDYLEDDSSDIAHDALNEFLKAPMSDILQVGRTLPPEKLRRWLKTALDYDKFRRDIYFDSETDFGDSAFIKAAKKLGLKEEIAKRWRQDLTAKSEERIALYSLLLGCCGNADDAAFLKKQFKANGLNEHRTTFLTGHVLLNPKEGIAYLRTLLEDETSGDLDALITIGFLLDVKPDGFNPNELLGVLAGATEHAPPGTTGMILLELAKRKHWDNADKIVSLYGKKGFDTQLLKTDLLWYALLCPKPEAAKLIETVSKNEADLVKRVRESLQEIGKLPKK